MDEKFLSNEILKIYEPYLSIFPEYNKVFNDLINNIIYKDNEGSFSLQYKLFYGFMASSTIGCENLLEDFIRIYSVLGGDKTWIEKGLECESIPEHIKGMANINNILAHKPWVMDWRHFAPFKKGLSVFFFQSAIILSTIQRFATIISGLNLLIINDKAKEDKKDNQIKKNEEENEIEKNEEKIKEDNKIKEFLMKKKSKKIKREELIQKVITSVKKNYSENNEDENEGDNNILINKKEIFQKYISVLIVTYSDFNPHIEQYLSTEDFNWKANAKYFFSDYAGKDMDYLNKELKTLENLSSEHIKNDIKINIFNLREAIEKYLSLIFGIKNEDYNYHNNNLSMSVELKRIIKKIACYPDQIQEKDFANYLEIINKEELIYLILIVTSIKQKISLTFFAKAFDDYTSNNS